MGKRQLIEWEGKHYTLAELARMHGISEHTVSTRRRSGCSLKDALTLPVKRTGRKPWQPDANVKAAAKRDWLENRELSVADIEAKYGVTKGTLHNRFGKRATIPRNLWGADAKTKAEAKVDWLENWDLSADDIGAKYGVDKRTLYEHFGKRGTPLGKRPLRQPTWTPEDIDL
jgi:hypothetical protein